MSLLKWSMILLYWLWLAIRNAHDNRRQHDWRLGVQILINLAVIALIVMEDAPAFLDTIRAISSWIASMYSWIRGLISAGA